MTPTVYNIWTKNWCGLYNMKYRPDTFRVIEESSSSVNFFKNLNSNSHTLKFTIVKYTIQWFLVYSKSDTTLATIKSQTISPTPKTPFSPGRHRTLPPSAHTHPTTTNLLSVSMDFPITDISRKWNHSMWTFVSVLHYFLWLNNVPLYGYATFCKSTD